MRQVYTTKKKKTQKQHKSVSQEKGWRGKGSPAKKTHTNIKKKKKKKKKVLISGDMEGRITLTSTNG